MLSLDDDARWTEIAHAYGPAGDVPDLLRALARGEDRDPRPGALDLWDRIWSALCHQGTTYGASYAAVPHVVAIGGARPRAEQVPFWSFVGAVAGSSDAAPLPPELAAGYQRALHAAETAALACLAPGVTEDDALSLLVALAGIRRQRVLMATLEGLIDGELQQECPDCGAELYVTLTALPFIVADQDPATGRPARTTPVGPATAPAPDVHAAATRARKAGLADLADRVAALDGVVLCPACGERFPLLS